MPDWIKIVKEIAAAVDQASREAAARQSNQTRGFTSRAAYGQKRCLFWDCNIPIRHDYTFCYDHFDALRDGLIDECPGSHRAKSREYDLCLDCHRKSPSRTSRPGWSAPKSYRWYKPEYSPAWDKRDAAANEFFVYVLKLDGGRFYAGQTRELRERLSKHRDGRVQSTAGQNPKLKRIEVEWMAKVI